MQATTTALILGRGRLGRSLTAALDASGTPAANVSGRDGNGVDAAVADASLVILAVPDAAIAAQAEALAQHAGLDGKPVVHLSGATTLRALEACSRVGCSVGSFHPFEPFPNERPPEAFNGIAIAVAASDADLHERLDALAHRLGATPINVAEGDRALYHAAGQVSGFVVALFAQAQQLLMRVGWSERQAFDALLAVTESNLANLRVQGLPHALAGAFRRGDVETVARHLNALEALPDAAPIATAYRGLGRTAIELSLGTGLDPGAAGRLGELLDR